MQIKNKINTFNAALGLALLAGVFGSAQASIMHTTCNNGAALCTIDTVTNATSLIGNFGFSSTFGNAFDLDGTMYATVNGNKLATVNLTTGAATALGNVGHSLYAIDFDSTGALFGIALNGNLLSLNKSTGVGTIIGNTGITSTMDIAFDSNDVLYGTVGGTLRTFNTTTGAVTSTISTGLGGQNMGISFDENDVLWATLYTSTSNLYTLNLTGGNTFVSTTGLSFAHGGDIFVASSVPEPATTALLALGLLGVGFTRKRRYH